MGVKGKMAREMFLQGYNCSQSVVAAFCEEIGLPQEILLKMSIGFGGGVGRMREVCGAFSGVVMVAGLLYGEDPKNKTAVYTIVQELARQSKEANGSIICKELLGLAKPEGSPVASERTKEYYKKRPCADLVEMAADMMEEYLAEHPVEV